MNVLIINPNTNRATTEALVARAEAIRPEGVVIIGATAPYGPSVVSRRRDIAVAATAVLAALAEHGDGVSAAVIGGFADPGLEAGREVMPFPVVGLLESSVLLSAQLGARIGLIYGGSRLIPGIEERLRVIGLRDRVCGIRTPPDGVRFVERSEVLRVFSGLAQELVGSDGAEVVILGGGSLIGLAAHFENVVPVPIVDSVDCAVLQACCLARIGSRKAGVGSYSRPAAITAVGLDGALQRLFVNG